MGDFLNGVETLRKEQKPAVQEVNKSIVCVLGTAPTFLLDAANKTLNKPVPIRNYVDVAKYAGADIDGFTLPDALNTILTESGGATVYMINVFDETTHKTSKTIEAATLTAGKYKIEDLGITNLVVTYDDKTAVLDTDYTFEHNTVISKTGGALASVANISLTYDAPDISKLQASNFIGTVDEDGIATGAKVIKQIKALFGLKPGIIICPVYSGLKAVRTELASIAEYLKAYFYCDAPIGTTINQAISGRVSSEEGAIDLQCTSKFTMICLPYVERYNSYQSTQSLHAPSPVLAGARVRLDKNRSVAKSINNTKTSTTLKLEYPIGFELSDADSESNALNEKGITTFINDGGQYYIWGGRSCNFPSESGIETFESVQRTACLIEDTIENSTFKIVGENVDETMIEDVLEMINNYLKRCCRKGDIKRLIYDGRAWYNPALNTAEEVANGNVKFCYEFCPLCSAERITYYSTINIKIITETLGGE